VHGKNCVGIERIFRREHAAEKKVLDKEKLIVLEHLQMAEFARFATIFVLNMHRIVLLPQGLCQVVDWQRMKQQVVIQLQTCRADGCPIVS
jgi:hypothetical protein